MLYFDVPYQPLSARKGCPKLTVCTFSACRIQVG